MAYSTFFLLLASPPCLQVVPAEIKWCYKDIASKEEKQVVILEFRTYYDKFVSFFYTHTVVRVMRINLGGEDI